MRRGVYNGPADPEVGGHRRRLRRAEPLQPLQLRARARPDGAVLTAGEARMRNVLPFNMMAHRDGPACALRHRGQHLEPDAHRKMTRCSRSSSGARRARIRPRDRERQEAREIYKIGVFYKNTEETLPANGFAPNRAGADQGFLRKAA